MYFETAILTGPVDVSTGLTQNPGTHFSEPGKLLVLMAAVSQKMSKRRQTNWTGTIHISTFICTMAIHNNVNE